MRVEVTNTGSSAGNEVVQLYVRDDVASITRPEKELRGVRRMSLAPAQSTTVTFGLTARDLAFCDADMQRVVEPGTFTVFVGGSSPDTKEARFEVTDGGRLGALRSAVAPRLRVGQGSR